MTVAVTAEGILKRYGDTIALEDVSLSVDSADVFALVGPCTSAVKRRCCFWAV
jgi:ABC-type multidrug transport system ATPase subunit